MKNQLDTRKRLPASEVALVLNQGIAAQKAGDFRRAEFHYQTVLRDHPKDPDALSLQSTLAMEAGKPELAVQMLRKALKQRPREPVFLHNLAGALNKQGKPKQALEPLNKALKAKPDFVGALVTLCDVHRNLGNSAEALTAIERATELAPDDPAIAASLGEVLVERGEMARATALFRAIDTGDPKIRTRALVGLAAAHKFKAEDPEPAQMDDLARSGTRTMPMRQSLLYATGKAFADQKDYAKAFEWFSTAKQEARVAFDIEAHAAAFEALRNTFTRDFVQTHQAKGNTSERPVFIVGMPRSGTTLTEQICASHPQVTGAGELRTMRKLANEVGFGDADQTKFGQRVAGASPAQIKKLAEAYLTVLKTHSRTAARVVDKMPHNYELLGLIAILFPNARVIHCQRDALDTCISCYTHNFSDAHAYNADLTVLGRYYTEYHNLMAYWHDTLPLQMITSSYEELVSNPEPQIRRIVDFMGLDWDDTCLRFFETDRLVSTPSRWQVRQPIYTSSTKSWRRYGGQIAPLITALGPLAVID